MSEVNLALPEKLTPHLRLDTETGEVVARLDEDRLRQIIREELERHDQRGLDHLMAAVSDPIDETDEMAAVLATLTESEWNALVERLHQRKGEQTE